MTLLTSQKVDKSNVAKTYAAASAGGDTFAGFPGAFVHVKNGNGSTARVLTIAVVDASVTDRKGGAFTTSAIVINIPANGNRFFAVPATHTDKAGIVTMTYDDEADLTIAVLYVAQ